MKTYLDKNGHLIMAGATIVHTSGDEQLVYRTQNASGEDDIGILATNPDFLKLHPDWEPEYYSLASIGLSEWRLKTVPYGEVAAAFRQFNREHDQEKEFMCGRIVFTADSFTEEYSELSRTYEITSQNKAFMTGMGGYSIYGCSLDGTDPCARLDMVMRDEKGGPDGWEVDYCYFVQTLA